MGRGRWRDRSNFMPEVNRLRARWPYAVSFRSREGESKVVKHFFLLIKSKVKGGITSLHRKRKYSRTNLNHPKTLMVWIKSFNNLKNKPFNKIKKKL